MFYIYNKSSEKLSEIENESIDLIITSPPYNIGTVYGSNTDSLSFSDYQKLLRGVVSESYRVNKNDGRLIIECADTIKIDGLYIELAGMIQSFCLESGYSIENRFINFVSSENGVELQDHGWDKDYTTRRNSHSNCHQIMVFSKMNKEFENQSKILYANYESSPHHPCPTPPQIYSFLLDKYFKAGQSVLDTFMGTAILGTEVQKRGGIFFGYELDQKIFNVAQNNLQLTKQVLI